MSRLAEIHMSGAFINLLLEQGSTHSYRVERDGLPPDAQVMECRMSDDGRGVVLTFVSNEFADAIGPPWPKLNPLISHSPSTHHGRLP